MKPARSDRPLQAGISFASVDGFWAGVALVILQLVAFLAVGRVEDVVLRRLEHVDLLRVRLVGIGLSMLGLLAGWRIPKVTGSGDLAVLMSAVLSVTALVVVGQAFAVLAFISARSFARQYVDPRRGHKT